MKVPGTGRTVLEFLAFTIWVILAAFVIRTGVDWLAGKYPNNLTLAMFRVAGAPLAGGAKP